MFHGLSRGPPYHAPFFCESGCANQVYWKTAVCNHIPFQAKESAPVGDELVWCEGRKDRSDGGDLKDEPGKKPQKGTFAKPPKKKQKLSDAI